MKSESEIVAFLGSKIHEAMNDEDGDLTQVRQDNLNYYLGKPYGNERDGYSSYITREVLEAVEWAMPSIVRVFTSGDRVVEFVPVGPEDEQQAEMDTDVTNHILLKENEGYQAVYTWCKDALLQPNGYAKIWPDESVVVETERYTGLTEAETAQLVADPEVEVMGQEQEIIIGPDGLEYAEFSIELKRTIRKPRIVFEAVAPEQVLVDNDLTSQNLDEADFVCHRVRRNYTWLVNNGYDRDLLDSIGNGEDHSFQDERTNRLFYEDEDPDTNDNDDPSMRQFWVHECYVRMDVDEDGVAERRRIVMIGATIFEDEETDFQPFVSMSSILMPHKHTGLSLADLVKDIQLVNSTLWRQLLDNAYRQNIRRKYIGEAAMLPGRQTLDALLDTAAEIIPTKNPDAIKEEVVQSIVGDLFPIIQGMTDQAQVRSGVTPSLALDPNVLQQSTMGAFTAALEQASERVELITRTFAETGFKRLVVKAHQLCREYMDHALQLKIGGKWIEVNPSEWRDRTNVTVNVGLGFNDKATKISLLEGVLEKQKEALGVMSTPQNIYNTLGEMVDIAGLGDVTKYFTEPSAIPQPEPQPDPQIELVMAQIQNDQTKLQIEAQKEAGKQQEAQAKLQIEAMKAQQSAMESEAKFRLDMEKLNIEREKLGLERVKVDNDLYIRTRSGDIDIMKIMADIDDKTLQHTDYDQIAAEWLKQSYAGAEMKEGKVEYEGAENGG